MNNLEEIKKLLDDNKISSADQDAIIQKIHELRTQDAIEILNEVSHNDLCPIGGSIHEPRWCRNNCDRCRAADAATDRGIKT